MNPPADDSLSPEGGAVLRFGGWQSKVLLGRFVVVNLLIAFLASGPAMADGRGMGALLLLTAAAALAMLTPRDPLELWRVLTIIGLIVVCTLVMLEQLRLTGPGGFLNWNLNASNFILFAVALRGRIGWAWIGLAVISAIISSWSLIATHALVQAFYLIYGEVGALLAGTFFAVLLRRVANQVMTLQAVRRQRVGEEHLRAETERERAAQLALVRKRVMPVLAAIASGEVSSAQRQ